MRTLFRLLSHCPLWLLHLLGAALGWLSFALSGSYRRRFLHNAALAGVPWRQSRAAVAHAGRMLAELPFLWLRPADRSLQPYLQWFNTRVIDAALARGRGVLFLPPHLGAFEVAAQAYTELYAAHGPITALYRPARKRWLRALVDETRARPGLRTAPATLGGVRQMMRALRRGEAVGLLPDQVPPDGMGVWAPFFGRPAYTMTLAARLVQQTGAAVVLVWGERLPRGRGYAVHCEVLDEPLPLDPGSRAESAAVINRAMERLIHCCPQQYLWGYHRYKSPRSVSTSADGFED